MAKANYVKAARKDYPEHGIKKGEPYWWWRLYKRAKRYSKTKPRRSQLTGSEFLGDVYDLEDEIEAAAPQSHEELQELINDWVDRVNRLAEDAQERLDNMPEGLQQGDSGQLLEERISACEEWASNLESIDCEPPEEEEDIDDDLEAKIEEAKNAATGVT